MSAKEVIGMTNATLLDPLPDLELMGNVLDLGRPELAVLMHRYCSKPPRVQTSLLGPPSALIVTRRPGEETPLREALENDAWFVKTCTGPGKGDCPVMRGEHCPLRESVDAAVVFVDPKERSGRLGAIPRLRCAADSSSPGIVALEGSLDPPRFSGGTATVGSLRGPTAVLSTIATLLGVQQQES
jgi:hypothetical protein